VGGSKISSGQFVGEANPNESVVNWSGKKTNKNGASAKGSILRPGPRNRDGSEMGNST